MEIPAQISGVVKAENITQVDRIKGIILGEPGSGKSWLLTTAPKPIFIYDFDDRRESIAGKKDVYIKTLTDPDPLLPRAWQQLEQDIGIWEWEKQQSKLEIKTFGLDSLTFMLRAAQNQLMKDQVKLARTVKINGHDYKIGEGFDFFTVAQKMIEGVVNRLVELNVHVIMTAHIRLEKAADWTLKDPRFTGKYSIEPQNLKMLLPKFNERWFMKEQFKVQLKPDYEFNAVTALDVDNEEEPDIEKILQKHAARVASRK